MAEVIHPCCDNSPNIACNMGSWRRSNRISMKGGRPLGRSPLPVFYHTFCTLGAFRLRETSYRELKPCKLQWFLHLRVGPPAPSPGCPRGTLRDPPETTRVPPGTPRYHQITEYPLLFPLCSQYCFHYCFHFVSTLFPLVFPLCSPNIACNMGSWRLKIRYP